MDVVLLDTTTASFLHPKKATIPEKLLYLPHLQNKVLAISFQTVAELFLWAEENRWGVAQRAALDSFISRFLVIPYDVQLARVWAEVMAQSRFAGYRMLAGDAWIAATALHRNIPFITHDKDFTRLSIPSLQIVCHAP